MCKVFSAIIALCCVIAATATTLLAVHSSPDKAREANNKLFEDFLRLKVEGAHGLTEPVLHALTINAQIDALGAALRQQLSAGSLQAINGDLDKIFAADEIWRQTASVPSGCTVDVISGISYLHEGRLCLQVLKPLYAKIGIAEPAYADYLALDKIVQPALVAVGAATDDALSHL